MIHGRLIARAATLAVAVTALVGSAATTSALAAAPGLAGRVAYVAAESRVITAEGDGTRARVAFDRGAAWSSLKLREPAFSPDGRKLAFSAFFSCDGCPLETSKLAVVDADGSTTTPLIVAEGRGMSHPTFSPDGKTLAFAGIDTNPALFTVPATGGTPTKVAIPGTIREPHDPAYSPDGRLLAFTALDTDGDRRVYVKNLENEQVSQVTAGSGGQEMPAFSPEGDRIAYVNTPLAPGGGFGNPELAVRPLGGGAPDVLYTNQVEQGRAVTGRPAFSPDGKQIAFTLTRATGSGTDCQADVMVLNLEGTANPHAIACDSAGSVDWALRTAKGVIRLASTIPGSNTEGGDGDAQGAAAARGGRYTFFASKATNLAAGINDNNGKTDIFRRDLASGKTELVSVDRDGKATDGESDLFVASSNGNVVAYRTTAHDVLDDGGVTRETAVVLRTMSHHHTALISRRQGKFDFGALGDNRPVAITPNGQTILFSSTGTDVTANQGEEATDTDRDLFLFDTTNNRTTVVSSKGGSPLSVGNGASDGPAYLSDDGKFVTFESNATDLVEGFVDSNGAAPDIFRYSVADAATTLVDGANGSPTEGAHGVPHLLGVDRTGATALFTIDAGLWLGTTQIHAGPVTSAALSTDGTHVFFAADGQVWMRSGGATVLVTRGTDGVQGANAPAEVVDSAADGSTVLVRSTASDLTAPLKLHDAPVLYRIDTTTIEAEPVTARGDDANESEVVGGDMSDDGNTIAFSTRSQNLVSGFVDGNGEGTDAYAWIERATAESDPLDPTVTITSPKDDQLYREGSVVLADYDCEDEGPSGLKSCTGPVANGAALDTSQSGEFEFTVTAVDNAGNITTKTANYRVAAANKKLQLASHALKDRLTTANARSDSASFSADGHYLVFASEASDHIPGLIKGNQGSDVYRRDMITGATELVSVGVPRGGDDGRPRGVNESARGPVISPDGRYVLFSTDATDVIEGQTTPFGQLLYLRDMQTGTVKVVTHRPDGTPAGGANPSDYSFSRDGKTIVFVARAPGIVPDDTNLAEDVFTYDMQTGAITLVSVEKTGKFPAAGFSEAPVISDNGRRVAFQSDANNLLPETIAGNRDHFYWRDLDTGVTKLIDSKWDKPGEPTPDGNDGGLYMSADGSVVLFSSEAGDLIENYSGPDNDASEDRQLYSRDMVAGSATRLVSNAWNDPKRGTGGTLRDAALSRDGKTVYWWTMSKLVVEGFVDNNDNHGFGDGGDLYKRRLDQTTPVELAAHGPTVKDGVPNFDPHIRGLSDDGRFATILLPTAQCDCDRIHDGAARLDLKRNRFNNVIADADEYLLELASSADGRRIAAVTEADNLVDGFVDANESGNEDVFTWYDAPPVAVADARVTGSLKLAFDATESADSDGTVEFYEWTFGDGGTGTGATPEHTYPDEDGYPIKLTIEDDGGNEVSYAFEVVAIKGVLTTGGPGQEVDFIGVDKHLRCSVLRGGQLFAQGSGACGTFVAIGGKTYGPPELIDGVEPVTPVSQTLTTEGDTGTLVTVVALGETGVQVRQTDAYSAGKDWYRTDVELVNGGADAKTATVYRAARCAIGDDASRRAIHDAGTEMAGCDGTMTGGRTLAALLPLAAGARRDAGTAEGVFGRIAAGQPLADSCACGNQPDPAAAIGWPVELPGKGKAARGSLAAFGPDGSIPLTFDVKADKAEVQPLDDNALTVMLHNANGVERPVSSLPVEHNAAWDVIAGSVTGLTTANPAVAGNVNSWADLKVAGHSAGEVRFGITHRSGQRTATSTVTPAGSEFASLQATDLAGMGRAAASVVARSIAGSKPNTAITSGPTGMTTDRNPEFKLEASKEDGIAYECRFGEDAWAPCEGNPHKPGPLADGAYTLEARAVDAVGADETPARRAFVVDTAAPATTISSGPHGLIADNRPNFFFSSNEQGTQFECRLGTAWFACESPYRPSALRDGEYTFEVRAIDAAGNEDATPAKLQFTIDTTPPVTVIDGVTAKVLGSSRGGAAPTAGGGSGSTIAIGEDGSAGVQVSCPAGGPACDGSVGLGTTNPGASAAQARAVPNDTITLTRAQFSAQPGETVSVRLPLPMTVRNTVDRVGRMAVFTTIDLGTGRAVRGSDVVLTPDPRQARLLDAGRTLKVVRGAVKLRIACASKCSGTLKLGANRPVKFKRTGPVRVHVKQSIKRGKELTVLIKTRLAPAKRLTLTLRAQEARR